MKTTRTNLFTCFAMPIVTAFLLLSAESSYGVLNDTFDPPNPGVTSTQLGDAPGPAIFSGGPSGQFLRLTNDSVNNQSNSYAYDLTDPGTFAQINAQFDFRITSASVSPADGFSFMLIPTSIYGNTGPGVGSGYTAFEIPNFSDVFGLGFDVWPHDTINQLTAYWDGVQGIMNLNTDSIDLADGVFHRVDFSLDFVGSGAILDVILTPDVFGTPGSPVTVFTDLYIDGISPYEFRVQFGGRTGGANASMDIDNVNVNAIPAPGAFLLGGIGLACVLRIRKGGKI